MAWPGDWSPWLSASLARLTGADRLRTLRAVTPTADAVRVLVPATTLAAWAASYDDGGQSAVLNEPTPAPGHAGGTHQTITLFSTNDYLGLSTHPAVRAAAAAAAAAVGCGPRSSALVGGGYTAAHAELEAALAELKETEDCLLLATGFAANTAVMAAFARCVKENGRCVCAG